MKNTEFKELRQQLKLTQKEMAERLGVGSRMYAFIESGGRNAGKSVTILAEQLRQQLSPHPN